LCDLGLRAHLVGRTGFCVHPRGALRDVPKVGGTKDVDEEKVRALAPTHLIVNVDENERPVVDRLRDVVGEVVVTHPIEVTDNLDLYARFGAMFDRGAQADALSAAWREALAANLAGAFTSREVIYLIWKAPWMTVSPDTYIAKMLATVGLRVIAPVCERRYPEIDWAGFDTTHVDALLLSSEPYRFGPDDVVALAADPLARGRHVALIDGEMTSWYGSRAIAGLRYLGAYRRALDETLARRRPRVAAGPAATA
jgi:ABC-type Fe3+-hydroxamate transport system substrate-binding protein